MDDYIRDGYLRAMAETRRITGEKQINAVGYCIAGTTLGLTLAHLQKAGDETVKTAPPSSPPSPISPTPAKWACS
jgi:polyhydroxyalkanoate synthase